MTQSAADPAHQGLCEIHQAFGDSALVHQLAGQEEQHGPAQRRQDDGIVVGFRTQEDARAVPPLAEQAGIAQGLGLARDLRLTLPKQRGQLAHGQLLGVAQGEQAQAIFIAEETRLDLKATAGLPLPLVEARARIGDEEVPWDGETMGELEVRGPWVASSYYDTPEQADRWTEDGWFRTGDIVSIEPHGYIQIKDRSKDVIKSGGEWISSVELENALMAHPAVAEAAVIAIPDAKWSERPLAAVVLREGATTNADELRAFLAPNFAKWWLPERFEFIDEIPKTSVGKFRKTALREQFAGAGTEAGAEAAPLR